MPPKCKFTKEQLAISAYELIKEKGTDALTARALGARLGTSSSPIFTYYKSMEEVKLAARELAFKEFEKDATEIGEGIPAFKKVGMVMIAYAVEKPEIFKLLFMQEHTGSTTFKDTIESLGNMVEICIEYIMRDYGLNIDQAKLLFNQMWVYTFGIGALCAMKVCDFTKDEISDMLAQNFTGALMVIKEGGSVMETQSPVVYKQ